MLYVFHGNNRKKVADQVRKLTQQLVLKKPDAQVFTLEGKDFQVREIDELIEAQGLFTRRHIVIVKEPMQEAQTRELFAERLKKISETGNIFIVLEDKLIAAHKKKLEKYAEKIEEHTEKEGSKEVFNVFTLTDELGQKNKRALWLKYTEALKNGIEIESIHGTLHWAVRGMLFALQSPSPEASGQKPFVYQKQKRFAGNYGAECLRELSRELIDIYHNARRGRYDMQTALERWILSL